MTGPGTLKLTAVNTYTAGTMITGGTLEVSGSIVGNVTNTAGVLKLDSSTALATSAILSLAASPAASAVNLNFTGSQTVNALYFGTVQQAAGTWGGTGSGATHINAAFAANTGVLNVTTGPAVAPPYSVASESVDSSGNMTMTWSSASGFQYHIIHGTRSHAQEHLGDCGRVNHHSHRHNHELYLPHLWLRPLSVIHCGQPVISE